MSEVVNGTQLYCEFNLKAASFLYFMITNVIILLSDLLGAKIWLPSLSG